jgi:hypothetical protein
MGKRRLALLLTLAMIISMFPINAFATEFSDMPNDWSTRALENAVANGLLKGDNGKIMPNENLTRAQMATIVNRAFGATEKSSIDGFTDVKKDAWYYDEMSKAVQMKTFIGSGDKLYPDNSITREEAFVVLARAFKISGINENVLDKFSDKDNISDWAVDGVSSLVAAGYIAGSNGRINPKQNITRAEFAQVMDNLLKNYINKEGTYTEDYSGNLMINVPNVTLKGITVAGDLILGDGIGDGDVTLDDVTITGRVLVRGGGKNSIKIIGNSNIQNIIIARVDGIVRIYAEDGTEIGEVIVDGNDDVIIEGNFSSVTIVGPDITVTAINANIESASIEGENSNIIVDENSSVKTINVNANNVNISGDGTVEKVLANANNVAVNTPNTSVTAGEGTTGVTAGDKPVEPGKTEIVPKADTTVPSGGGGGGGTIPSKVAVSAISVSGEDGATTITTDNGTLQMNAEVSPSDASNKSVTWSVTETDGSATDKATISSTGLLTAVKNGTVKVTATAQDGSGVTGSIEITISNQVAEVVDASVYDTLVGSLPKNNDDDTYTTPSWAAYQEAIDECDLTLTEADGQAALDAEVIKIQAALELLELTAEVDTSAYDAIVTEVGALVEADYTGDSWALYEAAIADCNLTLEAKDGQAALDAEVIAIQAALELLTEVIYSNYELTITGPETAEPEDVLLFNVTAKGDNTGNTNYAAVIYNYEVTGGEGTLEYLDGETWKALPLAGHFGPSGGFELTPDWDVTTQLRFTPAAEGSYSVEVTLDVVDGAELAKATHNIEVAEVVDTTAPELGEVTLTTDEDDNLVLTVVASDNAGLASLEVDHSLEDILPEFTVGTEDVTDEETGASSTFDEATGTWTLNFGPQVSKEIRER